MKIVNIFNKNGKNLQEIIEYYLIKYCLDENNSTNKEDDKIA